MQDSIAGAKAEGAERPLSAKSGHSAIPCTILYEYCYISISMSSSMTRTLYRTTSSVAGSRVTLPDLILK